MMGTWKPTKSKDQKSEQAVANMDTILSGILASDHEDSLKEKLINNIAEASCKPHTPSAVKSVLKLTADWVANGKTPLIQRSGSTVYISWAKNNIDVLEQVCNTEFVLYLLGAECANSAKAVTLMHQSLQLLELTYSSPKLLKIIEAKSISYVREHVDLESLKAFIEFLKDYRDCIPKGDFAGTFCQSIVHAMSLFTTPEDKTQLQLYLHNVNSIAAFLNHLWVTTDSSAAFMSLKAIFNIISATDTGFAPSVCLGAVIHFIPRDLIEIAMKTLVGDPNIQDVQMTAALNHTIDWLSWPTARNIDLWVIALLRSLAAAKRYSVLINVTESKIEQVFEKLKYPVVRESSLNVLSHMLLSFQHSPDPFHKLLASIPEVIQMLRAEKSKSSLQCLAKLTELLHCLMNLHAGFPELYDPVFDLIKDLPKPSSDQIKTRLNQSKWSGQRKEGFVYTSRTLQKSDTGRVGLVNQGNTCYMNSVIQALYMCDSFRRIVMLHPPDNKDLVILKLQQVFAFLSLSQRAAYVPKEFLNASRPPWFVLGYQQDCSEFLKYLLDQLHEQEKAKFRRSVSSTDSADDKDSGIGLLDSASSAGSTASDKPRTPSNTGGADTPKIEEVASSPSTATTEEQTTTSTIVEKIFGGKIITTYKCLNCKQTSSQTETFTDIPLAFPDKSSRRSPTGSGKNLAGGGSKTKASSPKASKFDSWNSHLSEANSTDSSRNGGPIHLNSLIKHFLQKERLTEENQYHCENCGGLQDGERVLRISETPDYLILVLLRFSFDAKQQARSKIFRDVKYPRTLFLPVDRSKFSGDNGSCEKKSKSDKESDPQLYGLTGVVVHSGTSSDCGHYYCYGRHALPVSAETADGIIRSNDEDDLDFLQENWYLFNDSRVSSANYRNFSNVTKRFNKDTPYVLVYKKLNMKSILSRRRSQEIPTPFAFDPAVRKDLREIINKDNTAFLQEQEKEAQSQAVNKSSQEKPTMSWLGWPKDDDDDQTPPGSCGGGMGLGMSGPPAVF